MEKVSPQIKSLLLSKRILYVFKTVNYDDSSQDLTVDDNIYKKVKDLTRVVEKFQNQSNSRFHQLQEFMDFVKLNLDNRDKD